MLLDQLNSKKQFFIIGVVLIILLGLYAKFRMWPAFKRLNVIHAQLEADEKLLRSPKVPDEPRERIDNLNKKISALDVEIESLNSQTNSIDKALPDTDNQDVVLRISETAKNVGVRVINNLPLKVARRKPVQSAKNTTSKKRLSAVEEKFRQKALRKQQKKARKKAKRNALSATSVRMVTYEGELMDRLVNDFETSRPLHSLKLEGNYHNIRVFIEALQGLPWQITVVKVDYRLSTKKVPKGFAQLLEAQMIIGL